MGIEKRDRAIKEMFDQISIKHIPMKYVDQIVVGVESGENIVYGNKDVRDYESIEALVNELPDELTVTDLGIRLAYHKMEIDIKEQVQDLVKKYNEDR